MEHQNANPSDQKDKSELPAKGERALVRCPTFRCLAYRDAKGKWRDANDHQELPEVLEVITRL
jgi:hypothetical protein